MRSGRTTSASSWTYGSGGACAGPSTRGRTRSGSKRRWPTPGSRTATTRSSRRRPELRHLQYAADARAGAGKRSRVELAPEYVERYAREILGQVDLSALVAELPADAASALMCVERDPEACHRSLIAERLAAEFGLPIVHITP